jgi:hypothetical protein
VAPEEGVGGVVEEEVAAARWRRDTAAAGFEAGGALLTATHIFSPDLTPTRRRKRRGRHILCHLLLALGREDPSLR